VLAIRPASGVREQGWRTNATRETAVDEVRNLIIIGSGPAGYTAAVYAARANLKPLMIEGVQSGGALMTTTDVENFPGFPDGIMGPELMDAMRKQAERFGAEFLTDDVTRVELTDTGVPGSGAASTAYVGETAYRARSVILATGSAWRPLGVPGEQEFLGHGVSSCATCDGFFFRGQDLAVVGGGDSAMEEALFLTRFATNVTVIHRRDELRASKIMQERAFENDKIEFVWNSVVEEVLGDGSVKAVRVRNVDTDELSDMEMGGLFVAIGHTPNTSVFEGQVEMENGYIVVREPTTATNVEGVFAAGDVVDHIYRQAVTAAGMGCKAAMDAERFLEAHGH
jgi:thioredoxin reductase (NADPH)